MNININKEKFSDIESSFDRLKTSNSDTSALRTISDSLHSLTNKNITIEVISPESRNQSCNVMSVYPEESVIDKIVEAIITEQQDSIIGRIWNESSSWIIEIDSRVLTDDVNLTAKELTALLMHEVGHIIYSNTVPTRIARVLRFEYAKTNVATKQLFKDRFFKKLLSFPILNACNFNKNRNSLKHELDADKYSVNSGYGNDLSSAIDKIMIYAGSSKTTEDDDMKDLMGFSVDSLISLQKRQNNVVRRNMVNMVASTPSRFVKKIITPISNGLHGSLHTSVSENAKDKYLNDKIESILESCYVCEGIFNHTHKMKRIDPADIDYIGLEVNNIKNNDDKMMIVSYIYNKLDTIDYYIALIDSKKGNYIIPHSRESLVKMREMLDRYRIEAINRKLPEVSYGISIQYPSGYEG